MGKTGKSRPRLVQGGEWVARFIFIAGRLCLDFAHTGGSDPVRAPWERLHRPADLADWFAESPLQLSGVEVTAADLASALALREAIWRTAQAIRQGEAPRADDVAIINDAAAAPDLRPQLVPDSLERTWRLPVEAKAALATIARDAVDLFSSEMRTRIRKCDNPRCQLIFVDTSRPGKRRWCAMERCGNMAKVARHRGHRT